MGMVIAGVGLPSAGSGCLRIVIAGEGMGPKGEVPPRPLEGAIEALRQQGRARRAAPGARDQPRQEVPTAEKVLTAEEWAIEQFATVQLGRPELNQRAVEIASKMAACPEASLPNQMENRQRLIGAYRLLNNERVTMESLLAPHRRQTLAAAERCPIVLMVEDTTELDYSGHRSKTGLGPIGNDKGQGLLLHSTLAVMPDNRQLLGLAHAEVVLRQPKPKPAPKWSQSPESELWENSVRGVGRPPEGVIWVHVSDRGSDDFGYMACILDHGKEFLIRAKYDRVLQAAEGVAATDEVPHLLGYARGLPACQDPEASYTVQVPAHKKNPAREARVVMAWGRVTIQAPSEAPKELRCRQPIEVSVLRVWEPDPPAGVEAVEWILLSSLPISTVAEALRAVAWYCCRWLCEDYHMCLKTGCQVEDSQLDDGADIRRLLGFAVPIAVRLLQLRQTARQTPDLPAKAVVEPLMVEVLALRQHRNAETMTIGQFWLAVATMGGHQGRRGDGPPGWRTVWKGWRRLAEMTEGARIYAQAISASNIRSV